ncbi:lipopolysaccharide assembly protein LapB [Pseudomonadota bacterium]
MPFELLWLLLPVAAASGYLVAKRESKRSANTPSYELPQDYYKGLNYILNEQPDKAIDIFLRLSELDDSTLELHLSLGNLFRKRGEVDRAIRLHQSLVNHPSISTSLYNSALQELAQDYMSAGLLDRAENLCLELVDADKQNLPALRLLRELYQQEKEWFRAIDVTRKIAVCSDESYGVVIAHYYCELAEGAKQKNDAIQAHRMLEKAHQEDSGCARATILKAEIERQAGSLESAIGIYQSLEHTAPEYLPEVLEMMSICYQTLGWQEKMVAYLKRILSNHHAVELVLMATRMLKELEGEAAALSFLGAEVVKRPSLRGVQYLLELDINQLGENTGHLSLVKSSLDKLLTNKPVYRCNTCGFTGMEMHWCCPSCKGWSSIKPIQEFQWGASI